MLFRSIINIGALVVSANATSFPSDSTTEIVNRVRTARSALLSDIEAVEDMYPNNEACFDALGVIAVSVLLPPAVYQEARLLEVSPGLENLEFRDNESRKCFESILELRTRALDVIAEHQLVAERLAAESTAFLATALSFPSVSSLVLDIGIGSLRTRIRSGQSLTLEGVLLEAVGGTSALYLALVQKNAEDIMDRMIIVRTHNENTITAATSNALQRFQSVLATSTRTANTPCDNLIDTVLSALRAPSRLAGLVDFTTKLTKMFDAQNMMERCPENIRVALMDVFISMWPLVIPARDYESAYWVTRTIRTTATLVGMEDRPL